MTPPAPYTPGTYAPPTPTAQYVEGNPIYDELQRRINHWAEQTDPQRQAEQDKKIQRGRNFWTGANLFANVIANAINASGTAKGAPSMTFNDAAQQKMYDTWRDQDKELKAERRAAQERLDALTMQDASLRHADRQAADKAALDAYNRNYEAGEKANQARYAAEMDEFKYQRGKQDAAEKTAAENAEWTRRQEWLRQHPMPSRSGGGSKKSNGERSTKYDLKIGGFSMQADTAREQNYNIYTLSDTMYSYLTEHPEALGKNGFNRPTDLMGRRKFVEDNFQTLYDSDAEFRNTVDAYYGDRLLFNEQEETPVVEETNKGKQIDPYTQAINDHAGTGTKGVKPQALKDAKRKKEAADWIDE